MPLFTSDPRAVLSAASNIAAPADANAYTIDYSVDAKLDDSGKMSRTTRLVTRVLRLQGIEGSRRINIPWIESRQNRPKLTARVITSDGRPHLLNPDAISETPNLLTAVLPNVDVDSVVEAEIDESDRETAIPGARLGEVVVGAPFVIGHFRFTLNAPPRTRVETRGFPSAPASSTNIEISNLPPSPVLGLLPPEITPRPTITFTNVPNWQAAARWYAGICEKFVPPVKSAPAGDTRTAIEAAFDEMRKTVHDNGASFAASPYTPNSPTETLKKGSGDSKDEAILLISKLAELGIAAKPALISTDPQPDVPRDLPGLEGFNRMLVYVPSPHPLWIDPTAQFAAVSHLPVADQGRWALIVDPSTTDLVRTPESTAADNRQSQTVEVQLRDNGAATVTLSLEDSGAFEDLLRSIAGALTGSDTAERDTAQTRLLRIAGAQKIIKVDTAQTSNALQPAKLQLTAEGYAASQVSDEGGFIDLPGPLSLNFQRLIVALRLGDTNAPAAPPRPFDYYVPPAFTEESAYHVTPPAGYRFPTLPPVSSLPLGPIQLSGTAKFDPD
ncbi:MAG: DUF3857 domain-containing protein, partial [Acidobacteriaceae bacterium]|nr:DUF3857 domain-containing protein [Acidobacteriaceae bacterium]